MPRTSGKSSIFCLVASCPAFPLMPMAASIRAMRSSVIASDASHVALLRVLHDLGPKKDPVEFGSISSHKTRKSTSTKDIQTNKAKNHRKNELNLKTNNRNKNNKTKYKKSIPNTQHRSTKNIKFSTQAVLSALSLSATVFPSVSVVGAGIRSTRWRCNQNRRTWPSHQRRINSPVRTTSFTKRER